jgi:O-methyltransferase involved in polyketide biosynthesis
MSEATAENLSDVSETLLIPLYYRAMETQRPDAMIKDEKAVELIKRLGSDGSIRYDSEWLKQPSMSEANKVLRIMLTREMDCYARDFLVRHPDAIVVHIDCGLDSRFDRVDNGQVEWHDLDFSDVIQLRRKFIGNEEGRYHLLGCSVLKESWLETVMMHCRRLFLFLAKGVFMYFDEA